MKKRIVSLLGIGLWLGVHACGFNYNRDVLYGIGEGTAGIRAFNVLFEAYTVATGLDAANTATNNYYNSVSGRLSADGTVESVSASMLLASTALAGVFCQEFVRVESQKAAVDRIVHKGVDFSKNQTFFTLEQRMGVVQRYADRFWQRTPSDEETNTVLIAMSEAETGAPLSTTELRNVLRVGCTTVAASVDGIKH